MKTNLQRLLVALLLALCFNAAAFGAPAISQQPASANWTLGQTGTLTVGATGSGTVSYQWRKYGSPIAGATAATLTVNNVTLADAGLYDVAVTDSASTVASAAAQVNPVPAAYPNTMRPKAGFNARLETVGTASAILPIAGGGFYALGSFTTLNSTACAGVARFLASGAVDPSFTPPIISGPLTAGAIQSDGKLLIAGSFHTVAGVSRNGLARLNTDGTLDTTLDIGTGFGDTVNGVAIQSDGSLLVGGYFTTFNGAAVPHFVRLSVTGTLDTAFQAAGGSGFNDTVNSILLQPDGKIVVSGRFGSFNGTIIKCLARLNAAGSLDTGFATVGNTGFYGSVGALALDSTGRILAAGILLDFNNSGVTRSYLVRINPNGQLDASLLTPTTGPTGGNITSIALDSTGRIIIGGNFTGYLNASGPASSYPHIMRLNAADGSLDTTFAASQPLLGSVTALALLGDGQIVTSGSFVSAGSAPHIGLVGLDANGTPESTITAALYQPATVGPVVALANGQWLVGGNFHYANGVLANGLARLNADGSTDTTYATAIGAGCTVGTSDSTHLGAGQVYTLLARPDGKIYVGGDFDTFNNVASRAKLIRLNADGTFDAALTSDYPFSLDLQADGKMVAATNVGVARFNTDGSVDSSFVSAPFTGNLDQARVGADGTIYIAGANFKYGTNAISGGFLRMNAAGAIDPVYPSGLAFSGTILSVVPQADGRAIIGGALVPTGGNTTYYLSAMKADGTLDAAYTSATQVDHIVFSLMAQGDGKVIAAGSFGSAGGLSRHAFARFNSDGTVDPSFNVSSLVAGTFQPPTPGIQFKLSPLADGSLLASGTRFDFSDSASTSLVLLEPVGPAITVQPVATTSVMVGDSVTLSVTATAPSSLTYQWYHGATAISGATASSYTIASAQSADSGNYSVQVTDGQTVVTSGTAVVNVTTPPPPDSPAITSALTASGTAGAAFSYQIAASNTPTSFNATGVPVGLTLTSATGIIAGIPTAPGVYHVTISATNSAGTGATQDLVLTIAAASGAPAITSVSLAGGAVGTAFSYQITASNSPTLYGATGLPAGVTIDTGTGAITGTPTVSGQFNATLTATNAAGTSAPFTLYLTVAPSLATPMITSAASVSVVAGQSFTYVISATNSPVSFTISTLPPGLSADTTAGTISGIPTAPGLYAVTLSANNSVGTGASFVLTINVTASDGGSGQPIGGHLVNLSTRASVSTGDNVLIVGFVVTGSAPKPVMIRGVGGAALTMQNVSGPLPDPVLDLYHSGTVINHNDNWTATIDGSDVASLASRVGAFPLTAGSPDSVVYTTLQPGVYSVILSGNGSANTGVGLLEIYDEQDALTATSPRLVNLSSRGHVGTGDQVMIAGFVIAGDQPRQVLIRGVGPTLATMNVASNLVLTDPAITLYHGADVIATNDNWGSAGDSAALTAAASTTGAFALPANSKDAAMLVTLQPGLYSVIVTGANNTTGIALVELYEMP